MFDSFFLYNYQKELKNIRGSDLVCESIDLLDNKLHRVRLKRGGSYINSPKWLKNKKAVINPKNENDDECLRWSIICDSKEITLLYKSEHNYNRENKVLLLMISDDDEKYYFAVKSKL